MQKPTIFIPFIILATSCTTLPQLYQAVEDMADDEAIQVMVSREAIQAKTDVEISVSVNNNPTTNK